MERIGERPQDERAEPTPAAKSAPAAPPYEAMLALQRGAGNQAAARYARLSRFVAQPQLDGASPIEAVADAVTNELMNDTPERALGIAYVFDEVTTVLQHDPAVQAGVMFAVGSHDPVTIASVAAPVRKAVRRQREARHLRWLRQSRAEFEAQYGAIPDKRGLTLREHRDTMGETNARHYRALDEQFRGQEILWRFTSKPGQEEVYLGPTVDFAQVVTGVNKHTGGNRKDDPNVRTLSFGRNLGALIGIAYSPGGDVNVAAIVVRAPYLYGVPIASLAAHGITAHPAEGRLIGIFETEYVLLGTPGDPARKLEDLATIKLSNPFVQDQGLLPGKDLATATLKSGGIEAPSDELEDPPAWFSPTVVLEAQKFQAAAKSLTSYVQMKDFAMGVDIDNAVRQLHANLKYPAPVEQTGMGGWPPPKRPALKID
jgi:hypothetical protein